MTTRALSIRNALIDALQDAEPASVEAEHIHTDLRQALGKSQRPAIVVEMGDEDAPEREYNTRRRAVALTVRLLADGTDPFAVIDPIREAAHAAIMADKTLGGICDNLEEGSTSRERADLDVPLGAVTTVYRAVYTTTGEALT